MREFIVIENPEVEQSPASDEDPEVSPTVPPGVGEHRPSVFYFRKALRDSGSHEHAIVVGLNVCNELEQLKAWVREQGMIPPKWIAMDEEANEKGWEGEPVPDQSKVIGR